jgi:hypothetical protein
MNGQSQAKIGAEVVRHGRYVTFQLAAQLAAVAVPRRMFAEILSLMAPLRAPPAPTRPALGQMHREIRENIDLSTMANLHHSLTCLR